MRYRGIIWWGSMSLILSLGTGLLAQEAAPPGQTGAGNAVFKDEPPARALYDRMIAAFRQPQTLSYKCEFRWEAQGEELGRGTNLVLVEEAESVSCGGAVARWMPGRDPRRRRQLPVDLLAGGPAAVRVSQRGV